MTPRAGRRNRMKLIVMVLTLRGQCKLASRHPLAADETQTPYDVKFSARKTKIKNLSRSSEHATFSLCKYLSAAPSQKGALKPARAWAETSTAATKARSARQRSERSTQQNHGRTSGTLSSGLEEGGEDALASGRQSRATRPSDAQRQGARERRIAPRGPSNAPRGVATSDPGAPREGREAAVGKPRADDARDTTGPRLGRERAATGPLTGCRGGRDGRANEPRVGRERAAREPQGGTNWAATGPRWTARESRGGREGAATGP